jgi:hypothetical protein
MTSFELSQGQRQDYAMRKRDQFRCEFAKFVGVVNLATVHHAIAAGCGVALHHALAA